MRNFQDTFETLKQSFISAFSICMTVPLNQKLKNVFLKSQIYRIKRRYHYHHLSEPFF